MHRLEEAVVSCTTICVVRGLKTQSDEGLWIIFIQINHRSVKKPKLQDAKKKNKCWHFLSNLENSDGRKC